MSQEQIPGGTGQVMLPQTQYTEQVRTIDPLATLLFFMTFLSVLVFKK